MWSRFPKQRPVIKNAVFLAFLVASVATGIPSGRPASTTAGEAPMGTPPADRQLLWFAALPEQDPLAVHLKAFDWSGQQAGKLVLPCRAPCSFEASPDGQRLLVSERPAQGEPPTAGVVYDVRGRRVGTIGDPAALWADDSRHLCRLRQTDSLAGTPPLISHAELDIVDPERGQVLKIANLAGAGSPPASSFWELLACSLTSDRAVVAVNDQQALHNVRVVELSTGRTLYARDDLAPGAICGCSVARMLVSPDANVAVDNLVGGGVQTRSLATGQASRWPAGGPGEILGLSWRGRRALVSKGVIEVGSDRLVWRVMPGPSVGVMASRPGSDDLLLYLAGNNGAAVTLIIVQADGPSIPLAGLGTFPDRHA